MNLPRPLTRQLTQLFQRMDEAYDQAAMRAGFGCNGCKDNCCLTRFYHHTLTELFYLKAGLAALSSKDQTRLQNKAHKVLRAAADLERRGEPVRVMCPLNEAERCSLYAHRPMICRLHGIPHTLRRPDGRVQTGPGCDDFYTQSQMGDGVALDRTPLYVEMARIEKALRHELGFNGKIRMTIAEMIITDSFKF